MYCNVQDTILLYHKYNIILYEMDGNIKKNVVMEALIGRKEKLQLIHKITLIKYIKSWWCKHKKKH